MLAAMTTRLSGTGIWSTSLRYGDAGEAATLAAELEALGYSALWIPDIGGDLFGPLGNLLGATTTATIATGILNVWMHTPVEAAAEHARLQAEHGPRGPRRQPGRLPRRPMAGPRPGSHLEPVRSPPPHHRSSGPGQRGD